MFALSAKRIALIDVANCVANLGGRFSVDLPNDYNVARIQLRVINGKITIGTASALAVQAGGAANLFSSIHLQTRDPARWDLDGFESQLVNYFFNQGAVTQTDPILTTGGDRPFSLCVTREFVMERMVIPTNHRGILPCRLVKDMQLQVQIVGPSAILQKDATTTLAYTAGTMIEVTVEQAIDSPSDINFYLNEQLSVNRHATALMATGETEIKLDTSGKIRAFILYARKTVAGGAGQDSVTTLDDTLVDNIKLYVGNNYVVDQSWNSLREENFRSMTLPAPRAGVAVIDFTKNYQAQGLLPADEVMANGQSLYLKPNCAVSAASSIFGIITVRLWDNPVLPLVPPTPTGK